MVTFLHHKSNVSQNVSEPNADNLARDHMETEYIWYRMVKEMRPDYFKKVFGKIMINPQAESQEEILCEKFFVMYRSPIPGIQTAAIKFYYDVFEDERAYQVLKEKYGYYNKDFHRTDVQIGYGKELKNTYMLRQKLLELLASAENLLTLRGENMNPNKQA